MCKRVISTPGTHSSDKRFSNERVLTFMYIYTLDSYVLTLKALKVDRLD